MDGLFGPTQTGTPKYEEWEAARASGVSGISVASEDSSRHRLPPPPGANSAVRAISGIGIQSIFGGTTEIQKEIIARSLGL